MAAKAKSKLQQKAALRVDRNVLAMGAEGQMEADPRYRANFLGNELRQPLTASAELSMRNIAKARALASDVRKKPRQPAKGGF